LESSLTRWTTAERDRLTALLDKLAAVQMDLKPLCNRDRILTSRIPPEATISEAVNILRSASDDLRRVIRHLDGMASPDRDQFFGSDF
jgi:hypothetical protein